MLKDSMEITYITLNTEQSGGGNRLKPVPHL